MLRACRPPRGPGSCARDGGPRGAVAAVVRGGVQSKRLRAAARFAPSPRRAWRRLCPAHGRAGTRRGELGGGEGYGPLLSCRPWCCLRARLQLWRLVPGGLRQPEGWPAIRAGLITQPTRVLCFTGGIWASLGLGGAGPSVSTKQHLALRALRASSGFLWNKAWGFAGCNTPHSSVQSTYSPFVVQALWAKNDLQFSDGSGE